MTTLTQRRAGTCTLLLVGILLIAANLRAPITGLPPLKADFEPLVPGAHKVPNTNIYRADEHLRDVTPRDADRL